MASSLYRRESRVERANAQLISKTQAATIALDLIRREGVEAVTIRRLAEELDVKSASLYYHFRNKDDILSMAARVALRGLHGTGDPDRPWQDWLLDNTIRLRKALLAYPDLIPTVMRRHPLHIGTDEHEKAVQVIEKQGAPLHVIMPMFDALEALACGSALYTAAAAQHNRATDWQDRFPALHRVFEASTIDEDQAFEISARSIIEGFARTPR